MNVEVMDETKSLTFGGSEWINHRYIFSRINWFSGSSERIDGRPLVRDIRLDTLTNLHSLLKSYTNENADVFLWFLPTYLGPERTGKADVYGS